MKFRELNQRRNLLESLLRQARELDDGPQKRIALPAVLQAIIFEKRGQHDLCDRALGALALRLEIGFAHDASQTANDTTQNSEAGVALKRLRSVKTRGT